jgi:hypothetical protein
MLTGNDTKQYAASKIKSDPVKEGRKEVFRPFNYF